MLFKHRFQKYSCGIDTIWSPLRRRWTRIAHKEALNSCSKKIFLVNWKKNYKNLKSEKSVKTKNNIKIIEVLYNLPTKNHLIYSMFELIKTITKLYNFLFFKLFNSNVIKKKGLVKVNMLDRYTWSFNIWTKSLTVILERYNNNNKKYNNKSWNSIK